VPFPARSRQCLSLFTFHVLQEEDGSAESPGGRVQVFVHVHRRGRFLGMSFPRASRTRSRFQDDGAQFATALLERRMCALPCKSPDVNNRRYSKGRCTRGMNETPVLPGHHRGNVMFSILHHRSRLDVLIPRLMAIPRCLNTNCVSSQWYRPRLPTGPPFALIPYRSQHVTVDAHEVLYLVAGERMQLWWKVLPQ